jgi:hypothetical protein
MSKVALIIALSLVPALQTMNRQERTTGYAEPFLVSNVRQTPDHGGEIESKYDGFNH